MDELTTVRGEIKSWERSFKSIHRRNPTIQDIRQLPSIADKYKLYKKLSKQRDQSLPHLLLSNPRTLETTAPLSTFNPFSPQKKNKQVTPQFHSNPFGSPSKPKHKQSSHPPGSPPHPTSAISRARKRLRGEPVSPSPNKDKRRRVASFPSLLPESPSDDEDHDMNLSFVGDSPVKVPAAGYKSFKLLFDDSKSPPRQTTENSLAQTKSASQGLFARTSSSLHSDEELEWGFTDHNRRKIKGTLTTNGNRFTKHPVQNLSTTLSEMRTSAKRPLTDTDPEHQLRGTPQKPPPKAPSLLPPSPPPPDSAAYHTKQGMTRSRANTTTRKKPKVANEHHESEEDEDNEFNDSRTSVKIVSRTLPRSERGPNAADEEDNLDFDSDPILNRVVPRGYVSLQVVQLDAKQGDGQFEVNLPDKLRQVLALQPSRARDSQTESVVKSLLYGGRAGNYDPIKGGEIWDAGEDDGRCNRDEDIQRDTEAEDDWEGEPIPWEVGEL